MAYCFGTGSRSNLLSQMAWRIANADPSLRTEDNRAAGPDPSMEARTATVHAQLLTLAGSGTSTMAGVPRLRPCLRPCLCLFLCLRPSGSV